MEGLFIFGSALAGFGIRKAAETLYKERRAERRRTEQEQTARAERAAESYRKAKREAAWNAIQGLKEEGKTISFAIMASGEAAR